MKHEFQGLTTFLVRLWFMPEVLKLGFKKVSQRGGEMRVWPWSLHPHFPSVALVNLL